MIQVEHGLLPIAMFEHSYREYRLSRLIPAAGRGIWAKLINDAYSALARAQVSSQHRIMGHHEDMGHHTVVFVVQMRPKRLDPHGVEPWKTMTVFVLVNTNGQSLKDEPRMQELYRTYDDQPDRPYLMTQILFWLLFEACSISVDENLFSRVAFNLQIPMPITPGKLASVRASEPYQAMQAAVEKWGKHPPRPARQSQRIAELITHIEGVLQMLPEDPVKSWGEISTPLDSPQDPDEEFDEDDDGVASFLEFSLYFDSIARYELQLFLFDGKNPTAEPGWTITPEGMSSPRSTTFSSDLIDTLIANRIFIDDADYDAWQDRMTVMPTQVFLEIDPEPYNLVGLSSPWLWPADELLEMLGGGT